MSSESSKERLPFEPRQKKKKTPPKAQASVATKKKTETESQAIPEAVSKRMVRRMALFSGIPTALGFCSFFAFYWIVSHQWFKVPTTAVLLTTLGLFGLGVVGLSYGLLSASWDEERVGSWLGREEFALNFGRTIAAWRSARKEAKEK
jgi:hypothetical protein